MKPIKHLVVGISLAILVVAPISMAQVIEEITVTARKKDRKSTRLNSSHVVISYAVFCLKKKNNN